MTIDINRRDFLKSLLAVGATVALPVTVAAATPAQIDTAWAKLLKEPWYFEVTGSGTIVDPDAVVEPQYHGEEWPRGYGPQGQAMDFFEGLDLDIRERLGVEIIEGDCPGSSYFAAELHSSIKSANRTAAALGMPFRFRAE